MKKQLLIISAVTLGLSYAPLQAKKDEAGQLYNKIVQMRKKYKAVIDNAKKADIAIGGQYPQYAKFAQGVAETYSNFLEQASNAEADLIKLKAAYNALTTNLTYYKSTRLPEIKKEVKDLEVLRLMGKGWSKARAKAAVSIRSVKKKLSRATKSKVNETYKPIYKTLES